MALRNIIIDGDPRLRKVCRKVDEVNDHIRTLLDDMAETMYAAEGVGLAAPQVGVTRRAVVVDVGDGLYEFVNPVLVESEGEQCGLEACLSVPEKNGYVVRPRRVVVEALDRNGDPIRVEAEGYKAVAFCHEIDHLDGTLFTDRAIQPTAEQLRQSEERNEEIRRLMGEREEAAPAPLPRGRRNTRVVRIKREG